MSLPASPFAYVPASSPLHRLSALPKLVWLAAGLVFCLVALHPLPLLVVLGAAWGLAAWAGVGGPLWRALRVLGPLAASIVVLQVASPSACAGGCVPLASIGPVPITAEALGRGAAFTLRLLAMASLALVMLVTTRPSDLFGALRALHVPYQVALVLATTMDLVPLLQRELGLVLDAQRARGLRATGLGAVVPAAVPVFVAAFERVGRLAISMEARGYGSGIPRTSYRTAAVGGRDRALTVLGAAAGAVGTVAGATMWGTGSVPPLAVPGWAAVAIVVGAAGAFCAVMAVGLTAVARA